MRNLVIGIVAGVVVIAGGLVAVISMQPAETHVERSLVVAASPADLWPLVSDHKAFVTWSPWTDMDPNQKTTFSDPTSGVGAWYAWEGETVGSGKMTITAVEPEVKLTEDLDFIAPFESHAVVTLALAPTEGGTRVTWGYDSPNGFMAKAMGLAMDMDTMLGGDFEKGLAKLSEKGAAAATARVAAEKAAAEAAAAAAAAAPVDPLANVAVTP